MFIQPLYIYPAHLCLLNPLDVTYTYLHDYRKHEHPRPSYASKAIIIHLSAMRPSSHINCSSPSPQPDHPQLLHNIHTAVKASDTDEAQYNPSGSRSNGPLKPKHRYDGLSRLKKTAASSSLKPTTRPSKTIKSSSKSLTAVSAEPTNHYRTSDQVLGHEGAGVVQETGPGAKLFKKYGCPIFSHPPIPSQTHQASLTNNSPSGTK